MVVVAVTVGEKEYSVVSQSLPKLYIVIFYTADLYKCFVFEKGDLNKIYKEKTIINSMRNANYLNMSNITHKLVKLLIPFSDNYSIKLSATEISKRCGVPQQTVSRGLNKLLENNIISYKIEGRNKLFYIDLEKLSSKNILNIIENHKSLKFILENKDISVILDDVLSTCNGIIVFGSYAKGTATDKSDIDIIIFGSKKKIDDIKRRYVAEINEHYSSYNEFGRLLKKENPLAIEATEKHIMFGDISKMVDMLWSWNYVHRQK